MRRKTSLRGQHVLVTGAASGIGRALAEELFLGAGAHVRLVDRDCERLAATERALRDAARGGSLAAHVADVTSDASVADLVAALGGAPLDVLVNCAGVLAVGPFERMSMAELERVIAVNLVGAARVTRALLPRLLESPNAFIANVASAAGLVGTPGLAAYSASKFGLVGFSDALRVELHGRAGVLAVCPTLIRTEIVRAAGGAPPVVELLERRGTDAGKAARAIVAAIERRERLLLINPDARLLYLCHRLSPALTEALVGQGYRWLQRKGILE